MKSPIKRMLTKVLLTHMLIYLSLASMSPILFFTTHAPGRTVTQLAAAAAMTVIQAIFFGLLLWTWSSEIVWTDAKKRWTTLIVGLSCISGTAMGLFNIEDLLIIPILAPPALFWVWLQRSPGQPDPIRQEEFDVRLGVLTPTVGRFILSIMLWSPVSALIFLFESSLDLNVSMEEGCLLISLVLVGLWMGIWFRAVEWTRARAGLTLAALAVAVVVEGAQLAMVALSHPAYYEYPLGLTAAGVFILLTTVVWQRTADEKHAWLMRPEVYRRIAGTPHCPECGFNLTGLQKLRCPECGRQLTVARILFENARMRNLDMQLDML